MNDSGNRGDADGGLRTAQAWLVGLVLGALVLALMGVAYVIGTNQADDGGGSAAQSAKQAPAANEQAATGPGKDLFAQNCGSCHTLSTAGTTGTAGPNLDDLAPDQQQVLAAIQNGGTGGGAMPAGLLEGEQAQQVADFVSGSAGQ